MDDEWYDYLQHDSSMLTYLDEEGFHIRVDKTEIRNKSQFPWFFGTYEWSDFVYDKELDSVTKLSKKVEGKIKNNDNPIIHMDNFFHQLLQLYSKKDWNDQDKLVLKIGGKALELFVNEARQKLNSEYKTTFTFNLLYAFALHFDFMQADFEGKIIRPLFSQAHLINSSDHSSRLLVFTELGFLVDKLRLARQCLFTDSRVFNARRDFKKKDRYIIFKVDITNVNELYLRCYPFEFIESIKPGSQNITSFQSTLAPRAINGSPNGTKHKSELGTTVIEALSDLLQSKHDLKDLENIMSLIADYFYNDETADRYILYNDSKNSNNDDTHDEAKLDIQLLDYYNKTDFRLGRRRLNIQQQMLIKNVSALEIYNKLLAPIQSYIKKYIEAFAASNGTFINSVNKLYIVPVMKTIYKGYAYDDNFQKWIARWISRVLLHYEKSINYKLVIGSGRRVERAGVLSRSFCYNKKRVLDYARDQLTLIKRHANITAPPYFLDSKQQEDILPPEKIIICSTTINKREEYRLEELLPILQDTFDVNLEIKAYYLQVQLYQEHIQLTLKQVVKVASNEENVASFVVEDRTISIENVYDSFCSRIINCGSLFDNQPCDIHYHQTVSINNNEDEQQQAPPTGALHTKKGYKEASINLKKYFNEILRSTDSLNLDASRMVKVNDRCDCRFSLSIRDFIDVALIPTIKQIAAVISGALVNKQCFGRYKINYIFLLLGDLLLEHNDGASSTFTKKILDTLVQEALGDSNQEKEIQPNCFYCTDTIESLCIKAQQKRLQKNVSKPPIDSSPSLNVTAISSRKGMLCPVSRETYSFCLSSEDEEGIHNKVDLFQQIDVITDKLESARDAIHSPSIIVEKGQHIPIEGIQMVFYIESQYGKYCHIDIYKMHTPHLQNHSSSGNCSSHNIGGNSDVEGLIYQESFYFDESNHIGKRYSSSTNYPLFPIYFSIKYDHPDSLLKISISEGDMELDPWGKCVDIGHPLTLAYF